MLNTHLRYSNAKPALLLLEPDAPHCSERAGQLDRSAFCVTRADSLQAVCSMRGVFRFSVAVFSDGVGYPALRASAEIVRAQWPKAQIVLLGEAPKHFDDNLYDETVPHAADGNTFMAVIARLLQDPSNQQSDALSTWLDLASVAPHVSQSWAESDPTKASGLVRGDYSAKDWPTMGHLRQAIR